ncbi:Os11g0597450 [Oryza sativa Japonica Group]|uniref:Os11g0597450 protein n=1 Tax=Oryza sativa subsp. japonica TaxID=39947 RepID=A0A0P0Y459_ORYSJ|nr:Os11g0597450 [Oryza sativa Japonica Group]
MNKRMKTMLQHPHSAGRNSSSQCKLEACLFKPERVLSKLARHALACGMAHDSAGMVAKLVVSLVRHAPTCAIPPRRAGWRTKWTGEEDSLNRAFS